MAAGIEPTASAAALRKALLARRFSTFGEDRTAIAVRAMPEERGAFHAATGRWLGQFLEKRAVVPGLRRDLSKGVAL